MDSFEAFRLLQADPRLTEVRILVHTVLQDPDSRLRGIDSRAGASFAKPHDGIELPAHVRPITRLHRYRRLLEEPS
jgi:DNA-binding response OmpR family regulator